MADTDLINKYRPKSFDAVVGQEKTIEAIQAVLKKKTSHTFIFVGSSGCGKTTTARICAKELGASKGSIVEVDAATYSGAEAMRELTSTLMYKSPGSSPVKVLIIDEAHRLSGTAWDTLLKALEEPPPHVYWFLCTTEPVKITKTIQTRCPSFTFNPVAKDVIYQVLCEIRDAEKMETPDEVVYLAAQRAHGSVRAGITGLVLVSECTTREEAAPLLQSVSNEATVKDLCKALMDGAEWSSLVEQAKPFLDQDCEGVRRIVVSWFTSVLQKANKPEKVMAALNMLRYFADPYPTGSGHAPLLMSLGGAWVDRLPPPEEKS